MSAADVRAALGRLREAGRALRERPTEEIDALLGALLDAWRAPGAPLQEVLVAALPAATGFAPQTLREGLARGLAAWSGAALRDLAVRERDTPPDARREGFAVTAQVLGGAIPLPTFVAVLAPLALRSPVLLKPSAHDRVTPQLLAREIAACDAELGACVAVADFRRDDEAAALALCEAPCLVVTGSDLAVDAFERRFRHASQTAAGPRRFVGHGHRVSLALLGAAATSRDALAPVAAAVALDVALWDQLGCLSPVSVLVADADRRAADRVAEALATALAAAQTRWPRGRREPEASAAIARERAEAELRAAAGREVTLHASPRGSDWTVVREADARARPAPLHRFVRVQPVPDLGAALDALAPQAARLAGVAVAGLGDETRRVGARLRDLGVSRVCAPGSLQVPPLDWPRDGLPPLGSLAREPAGSAR